MDGRTKTAMKIPAEKKFDPENVDGLFSPSSEESVSLTEMVVSSSCISPVRLRFGKVVKAATLTFLASTMAERQARRNVLMDPTEKAKVQAIEIKIHALKLRTKS